MGSAIRWGWEEDWKDECFDDSVCGRKWLRFEVKVATVIEVRRLRRSSFYGFVDFVSVGERGRLV